MMLGIRPFFAVCLIGIYGNSFLHANSEDRTDWANARADLGLCRTQNLNCCFVKKQLKYYSHMLITCYFLLKVIFFY